MRENRALSAAFFRQRRCQVPTCGRCCSLISFRFFSTWARRPTRLRSIYAAATGWSQPPSPASRVAPMPLTSNPSWGVRADASCGNRGDQLLFHCGGRHGHRRREVLLWRPRRPGAEMRMEARDVAAIVAPAGLILNRTAERPPYHYGGVLHQRSE